MSVTLPLLFDASGPVPTPPGVINQALVAYVATLAPGYTAALPGSLIEDLSSTGTGVVVAIDQARVDAVNSINPYSANPYLLAQQGYQFGLPQGTPTNGSADVVFSGTPGFAIAAGWLVGDGTNQFRVAAPGAVVGAGGVSSQATIVATNSNVFAIPPNSVTQLITQPPTGITLTVTNPQAGVPAQPTETTSAFRARILDGQQATIQGVNAQIKTAVKAVPGVVPRLVSVIQNGSLWEVICGGGDAYGVGNAIYQAVSSIGLLTGSAIHPERNVNVAIFDPPDSYSVVFVNPQVQTVTVDVLWNTQLANFTAGSAVNQAIITAVPSYVNSIFTGQPMNLLVLDQTVQAAVAPVLNPINLTTLEYVVKINGVQTGPVAGTSIIPSDPEGYFLVGPSGVTSVQG